MRLAVGFAVVCSLLATSCESLTETDFPESAVAFIPPAQFRVWWEVLESCSRQRRRFDDVAWFRADEITIRSRFAFGAWFAARNAIALLSADTYDGPLVRHEMLHAILRNGDHSEFYFKPRAATSSPVAEIALESVSLRIRRRFR